MLAMVSDIAGNLPNCVGYDDAIGELQNEIMEVGMSLERLCNDLTDDVNKELAFMKQCDNVSKALDPLTLDELILAQGTIQDRIDELTPKVTECAAGCHGC